LPKFDQTIEFAEDELVIFIFNHFNAVPALVMINIVKQLHENSYQYVYANGSVLFSRCYYMITGDPLKAYGSSDEFFKAIRKIFDENQTIDIAFISDNVDYMTGLFNDMKSTIKTHKEGIASSKIIDRFDMLLDKRYPTIIQRWTNNQYNNIGSRETAADSASSNNPASSYSRSVISITIGSRVVNYHWIYPMSSLDFTECPRFFSMIYVDLNSDFQKVSVHQEDLNHIKPFISRLYSSLNANDMMNIIKNYMMFINQVEVEVNENTSTEDYGIIIPTTQTIKFKYKIPWISFIDPFAEIKEKEDE
jgi:hypothetical protein